MSAVFESLKKLEQKENAKRLTVAKPFPEIEPEINLGESKNWLMPWLLVLTFIFIGFAFFVHLKYQGLNETVSSREKMFDNQINGLSKHMDEIDQKVKSMDKNIQIIKSQVDHFSKELEKEQEVQNKTTAQRTKSIEDRFSQLLKQIKSLEEKERQNIPPREIQVR